MNKGRKGYSSQESLYPAGLRAPLSTKTISSKEPTQATPKAISGVTKNTQAVTNGKYKMMARIYARLKACSNARTCCSNDHC